MGKSKRTSREFTREQKLVNENKRLKQELAQLRKQLARIDLDRYDTIKEMIEEHKQENVFQTGTELLENLKKTWACNEEGCTGHLEIILFNKIDTTYYYRKCTECPNRTKTQKYSADVKGIIKNQ